MKKMKTSTKGPSAKYDHFMRVSMDENEKNEKPDLEGYTATKLRL